MSLTTGQALGPYTILALLGAGGMGEVYRARDSRLGRDVAIKVLPADVARDGTRLDRFRREAKALAAIDHPNIVTVFSVEEAAGPGQEGIHFLTMQLVEGQSLEHVIPGSGLPYDRLLQIASAIAEALTAAHDKSIVHRDLKPANVMVAADGRVKVLDFGLAKDLAARGPADATLTSAGHSEHGVVMGTPAYMSPEQVAGRAVDHRSDLFSFGILLYQMASGERPFAGASSAELASAILRDTPPLVTELRGDLPADLARLIRRCLEKDPGQRIQTARDVANECRDLSRQVAQAGGVPATAGRASASGSSKPGTRPDEGFWVAVLPFKYSGGNADMTSLAEGLSEEIVTGLSRFSYLRVIARSASRGEAGEPGDARAAGQVLAARYVVEGSLRQAGSVLRVSVQLIDAGSGAHLWAETYDRPFRADDVFALQDDLVPRIVSTLADAHGILPHTMSEALRSKGPDQLSPYEAVLRSFGYGYRRTPEEHAAVRAGLERAVQQAPGYADGWAMLSLIYSEEYAFGFNLQPDPLGRTLLAARRAADAAPSSAMANNALARALFFRKEFQGFRTAAERALELNPLNGPTIAGLGSMMAYAGDWEHGCALVERAATLNPRHPGFYWFPLCYNAYRKGDYRGALSVALKINMPGFFYTHLVLAAVYGQLGERDAAGSALRELLALKPDIAHDVRDELAKWYPPALVAQLIEGLGKAGLDVVNETVAPVASGAPDATTNTATAKPSIAVLPFANMSADADQDYFSDGLAEEIITLLAGISGLKVIARTSSFSFQGKNDDIRRIAETLGVTSILEGSVRRAGSRIRVTAQLIHAADGTHLWSQRYDRELSDIFAVQDEIAAAIAGALKVKLVPGAERRMPSLPAYEAYLKYRSYQWQFTREASLRSRECLEEALALDPDFALPYVGLADYHLALASVGGIPASDAMTRARELAQRAHDLDPELPEAHAMLGIVAGHYDYDWTEGGRRFREAVKREPLSPHLRQWYATFWLLASGNTADALLQVSRVVDEDPLCQMWHVMRSSVLLALGRDDAACDALQKALELDPDFWFGSAMLAVSSTRRARHDKARQYAEKAMARAPWSPYSLGVMAGVLANLGQADEAERLLATLKNDANGGAVGLALYWLCRDDIEAAVEWAGKAAESRFPSFITIVVRPFEPVFRQSTAWPDVLKKMNL